MSPSPRFHNIGERCGVAHVAAEEHVPARKRPRSIPAVAVPAMSIS